ncbi:MAG: MerR family transcriptional regulator [Alistipes sp.]|jgi:DNA-binding transcriptional MerR regulator|nr:MerR family transcriptional regulator [Alistipes sp.]MBR5770368.1 MerR family transcriptional regulator [Alistipes sp.]
MAKLLYSMGEVTEMFDVNASLIRYWESKFDCIKPHKNKKGNRMFTPSDIENFKLIYHLVKEKGMTLEGANSAMKRRNKSVKRDVSILERLQNIRAMLVEVRESLGDNSPIEYEAPIEAVAELISDVEEETKAAVVAAVTTPEPEVEETPAEEPVAEPAPRRRGRPRKEPEVVNEDAQTEQPAVTRRRGRAKKNEEAKELFPFYEQSLF